MDDKSESYTTLYGATTDRLKVLAGETEFGREMLGVLMDEMPKAMCEGRMDAWEDCARSWIGLIASTAKRRCLS
jgi:hypothetical protein